MTTPVSRACQLLMAAPLGAATAELTAAGQLLAHTMQSLYVLRNKCGGLVPPIDQYGDRPQDNYTVLFLDLADAEQAKGYEEEERDLELVIERLSEVPELSSHA